MQAGQADDGAVRKIILLSHLPGNQEPDVGQSLQSAAIGQWHFCYYATNVAIMP
jgi:hypothetical protein